MLFTYVSNWFKFYMFDQKKGIDPFPTYYLQKMMKEFLSTRDQDAPPGMGKCFLEFLDFFAKTNHSGELRDILDFYNEVITAMDMIEAKQNLI
jgi:hypothetical protein